MSKKKKILYHSNHSKILSGFGKNAKNILRYLCSTGKYEVVELANGLSWDHPKLKILPWKAYGGLPKDPKSIEKINKDPNAARSAGYGVYTIENAIKKEKPDIYLGVEDIWGLAQFCKSAWWNKINCMVWTTLDSLPLLPDSISCASKIKNYYVWSSFAEEALKKEGHGHVKTLHGSVDHKDFYKLSFEERTALRRHFNINENDFIIGFVFRNQLRKSVPNLLEGYRLFLEKNPESNAKLILHSNWLEGWDIPRLIKEKNINPNNILCTYYCKNCKHYEIKPFTGNKKDCRFCGSKESQNLINIQSGPSEKQLNEIYNLMDVYCHPFTSGGQEIPLQEAKLTELITLTTDYSCGKDSCAPGSGGYALDWTEYREPGTQFIKASTDPKSIALQLKKVYKMDELKRSSLGKKARDFVIENYSINKIGSQLEEIFDNMPKTEWDFDFSPKLQNPEYEPPEIEKNEAWLIDIYKGILKTNLDESDDGHKHWMAAFEKGATRDSVISYFRSVATQGNKELQSNSDILFEDMLDGKACDRALFVLKGPEEDILLASSLFESFKESHKDLDIYFGCDPKYHYILEANPYVHKALPFTSELENEFLMIGAGMEEKNRYFSYYCNLGILTQKHINYRGIDNLVFDLNHE